MRSGISLAGGYAIRSVHQYLKNTNVEGLAEFESLQNKLESKIRIVTPAIDLISIIAARGYTTLDSTVQLTDSLRRDMTSFAKRLQKFSQLQDEQKPNDSKASIAPVLADIQNLLSRIEDAIPLISLALTTSGANLTTNLPETVSPSRLIQASNIILSSQRQHQVQPTQVGPVFIAKCYTQFSSSVKSYKGISDFVWKEDFAKCRVFLERHEHEGFDCKFTYHMHIIEDLDDGRVHEEFDHEKIMELVKKGEFVSGRKKTVLVEQISRLFFTASARLLNIEDSGNPVLVLKLYIDGKNQASLEAVHRRNDISGPLIKYMVSCIGMNN